MRLPDEFSNFFEIFVREPTTVNDLGVYVVRLLSMDPNPQTEVVHVPHVVTQHGKSTRGRCLILTSCESEMSNNFHVSKIEGT